MSDVKVFLFVTIEDLKDYFESHYSLEDNKDLYEDFLRIFAKNVDSLANEIDAVIVESLKEAERKQGIRQN